MEERGLWIDVLLTIAMITVGVFLGLTLHTLLV